MPPLTIDEFKAPQMARLPLALLPGLSVNQPALCIRTAFQPRLVCRTHDTRGPRIIRANPPASCHHLAKQRVFLRAPLVVQRVLLRLAGDPAAGHGRIHADVVVVGLADFQLDRGRRGGFADQYVYALESEDLGKVARVGPVECPLAREGVQGFAWWGGH